jgi:hypothetical protein
MRKEQASILKILSKDLVFHPKKSSPKNLHRVIINTKNHTVSDMNKAKGPPLVPKSLSSVHLIIFLKYVITSCKGLSYYVKRN